jgi:lipopolysaccharide transport system ATP-binding protein
MSDTIISVRNIGKKYKLGFTHDFKKFDTLRDVVMNGAGRLAHGAKRITRIKSSDRDSHSFIAEKNSSRAFWALKDISFDVAQGEVLGIIGANGAGKSTLLKILSQITEPTEGEIRIKGRIASLLEVGTGFHKELSGRENVYMNGAILGMTKSEIKAKFDEIVGFAEVEKFIDTPVKRYSSGMTVRLAFAVAAHLEPEILLIDEVLAVGDVNFQKKCLGKMEDVSKEGRTVLFISHNMAAVTQLCTRCILLENGFLIKTGITNEIVSAYLSAGATTAEKTPLSKRTDRKGSGRAKFVSIALLASESQHKETNLLLSGDDVIFKIGYSIKKQEDLLKNVSVGIQIFTGNGVFLFAMNNHATNQIFDSIGENGHVYCKLPHCPLMPGMHYLNLVMNDSDGLVDYIENAAIVYVEAGNFYGTGVVNAYNRQGVFVDHKWSNTLAAVERD